MNLFINIPQSQETFAEHFRGTLCGAGKFDVKNFAIQAASEAVNFYFKKISGNNTLNSIMLQNGVNEVGKGMEELNKK
jgi:hypothetical protein